jgi:hypothetical protein
MFTFLEFKDLQDGEIKLVIKSHDQPDYENDIFPRYGFSIIQKKLICMFGIYNV